MISKNPRITRQNLAPKNIKQILDPCRSSEGVNVVDSKKGWVGIITHKKPNIYDKFMSFHEITDADVMSKIIDSKYFGNVSDLI